MKAILEFTLPDEQEEFSTAVKGIDMSIALHEIRNRIFRPARKHGYPLPALADLMKKLGEDGEELVRLLEQTFNEILNENDVDDMA